MAADLAPFQLKPWKRMRSSAAPPIWLVSSFGSSVRTEAPCYSGATVDKFNAVVSFQVRFLDNGLRGAGVQVLTATRRDPLAPESVELGYGLLIYVLVQSLKGGADLFPKDGVVSSQDVARSAYDTLPKVFQSQRQKNPRAFQQAYGEGIQEPAIYSLGADVTLGAVGQ